MTSERAIHAGMNQRNAIRAASSLGCQIEHVRRTGEIRVSHPAIDRPVRINGRRKSASRKLTTMLRHIAARCEESANRRDTEILRQRSMMEFDMRSA
jgi:hypothetical protein